MALNKYVKRIYLIDPHYALHIYVLSSIGTKNQNDPFTKIKILTH